MTRMPRLARFITSQAAATVFCGTACILTGLHPFIHHLENGTLDNILEYMYATALNGMTQTRND